MEIGLLAFPSEFERGSPVTFGGKKQVECKQKFICGSYSVDRENIIINVLAAPIYD